MELEGDYDDILLLPGGVVLRWKYVRSFSYGSKGYPDARTPMYDCIVVDYVGGDQTTYDIEPIEQDGINEHLEILFKSMCEQGG